MMTTARKGIPTTQMARELGITLKSALFLSQRIRESWIGNNGGMGAAVEVDETYVGGKEKNKHAHLKLHAGRGAVGKTAVIGLRSREGQVIVKPIADTKRKTLHGFIPSHVKEGTTVYTDNFRAYQKLTGYTHETVNHSVGEHVKGLAHTNRIESFWALLKRGYYGISTS